MHSHTCASADTDSAAVVLACLFLIYSVVDILTHAIVFARRLA